MSNQQFMAVPYAFFALNSVNPNSGPQGPTGTSGQNGLNSLSKNTIEPISANCATGGAKIEYGLDANNNNTLDATEIIHALTKYIFNGLNGIDGTNGTNGLAGTNGTNVTNSTNGQTSLVKTTVEAAGANCTNGGFKTEYGLDANSNGTLDAGKINATLTKYVCNGIAVTNPNITSIILLHAINSRLWKPIFY